uniref:Uncharacterized protein n=1 Tax=Arundo donax TaxID=35708 RepID=A0A0A9CTR7_ARUDO
MCHRVSARMHAGQRPVCLYTSARRGSHPSPSPSRRVCMSMQRRQVTYCHTVPAGHASILAIRCSDHTHHVRVLCPFPPLKFLYFFVVTFCRHVRTVRTYITTHFDMLRL